MEENGIYRIIFKNKVKAELLETKCVMCPREGGVGEGLAEGESKVYRRELDTGKQVDTKEGE